MNDDEYVGSLNLTYCELPPQRAPDGRPWEDVGADDELLSDILDIDDEPGFSRFCQILRGELF